MRAAKPPSSCADSSTVFRELVQPAGDETTDCERVSEPRPETGFSLALIDAPAIVSSSPGTINTAWRLPQAVKPRPWRNPLDLGRPRDVREEVRDRILAAYLMPRRDQQLKPLRVVDHHPRAALAREDLDRDFLKALTPQAQVQVLDPQLRIDPQKALELAQVALLPADKALRLLGERAKPIGALPRVCDPD